MPRKPPVVGSWPVHDPRRIFVEGAQWWEWTSRRATMWPADRDRVEAEATRRFPPRSRLSPAAVTLGRKGGKVKSEAKAAASRENGKRGGRPLKGT